MTFAEILPALLDGKPARCARKEPEAPLFADREYYRLPPERRDTLELVIEYDARDGRPALRERCQVTLRRALLARDDWEVAEEEPK